MTSPLISSNSTWQAKYNSDRGALSDDNKTAADQATNSAFQAANAATPNERDAALSNTKDALECVRDSVGSSNGAVQDLTALVDVAQFQHDTKASKPDAHVLATDANAAVAALKSVGDEGEATAFAKNAFDKINQVDSTVAKQFAGSHSAEFTTHSH